MAPSSPTPSLHQLKPLMPSWDVESSQSGQGGHPAPAASVPHRAAPRPGVRWVGAAQEPAMLRGRRSPVGSEDAAWTGTEMLSASTSFPARFPLASRAQCGALAARGAGHSTTVLSLGGSPAPAGRMEPCGSGGPVLSDRPRGSICGGPHGPALCQAPPTPHFGSDGVLGPAEQLPAPLELGALIPTALMGGQNPLAVPLPVRPPR